MSDVYVLCVPLYVFFITVCCSIQNIACSQCLCFYFKSDWGLVPSASNQKKCSYINMINSFREIFFLFLNCYSCWPLARLEHWTCNVGLSLILWQMNASQLDIEFKSFVFRISVYIFMLKWLSRYLWSVRHRRQEVNRFRYVNDKSSYLTHSALPE